jgi:hypothetical protein
MCDFRASHMTRTFIRVIKIPRTHTLLTPNECEQNKNKDEDVHIFFSSEMLIENENMLRYIALSSIATSY